MAADISIHQYEDDPRKVIVLGVPTFGMVSIQWHAQQMLLMKPMNRIIRHVYVQGAEVGDARNEIIQQALASEGERGERCSHVFFVDDDCLLSPSTLIQLAYRDRPIVSGLYFAKTETPQPLVLHRENGGVPIDWTPGDLVECYAHGMGCTLIRAEVFEAMYDQGLVETIDSPCRSCEGAGGSCRGCKGTGQVIQWFKTTKHDVQLVSPRAVPVSKNQTEDVYFLERAAKAGYQPCVDTGVLAWHWDQGRREAFPLKQWREYRTHGTITWDTPNGPVEHQWNESAQTKPMTMTCS